MRPCHALHSTTSDLIPFAQSNSVEIQPYTSKRPTSGQAGDPGSRMRTDVGGKERAYERLRYPTRGEIYAYLIWLIIDGLVVTESGRVLTDEAELIESYREIVKPSQM